MKVYDPRTSIHVWPHHKVPDGQCAATDRGFFCTVKAGHDGWHAAYGPQPSEGTLHIWLDAVARVVNTPVGGKENSNEEKP